jgi:aspartokinase
LEVCMH